MARGATASAAAPLVFPGTGAFRRAAAAEIRVFAYTIPSTIAAMNPSDMSAIATFSFWVISI
jgi:hypothetical protein